MKKLLAILLATMLMLSIGSTALAAEDPYAGFGNFEMIVGHAQPEGNPRYVSMEKFAADVAEKTNGHVTVSVFGNGQLGTEKEMLEQVVQGVTQGMRGGQFDFSPRLLMFTAPFLTNTRAEVTALLQSDLAKKVCAEDAGYCLTTATLWSTYSPRKTVCGTIWNASGVTASWLTCRRRKKRREQCEGRTFHSLASAVFPDRDKSGRYGSGKGRISPDSGRAPRHQ